MRERASVAVEMRAEQRDVVTDFMRAQARMDRQFKRFFRGPIGSWSSPFRKSSSVDGIGTGVECDEEFARAKRERDAAAERLHSTDAEAYQRHVLGWDERRIGRHRADEARRRLMPEDVAEAQP